MPMPSLRCLALGLVLALGCRSPGSDAPAPGGVAPPAAAGPSVDEILAASDLPPVQPEPLPGDPMGVTVHRLSNGMTVYVSTDRRVPQLSAWIAVRSGGRNDPPDSTGLAHYLEHMLFKGTDELGTIDIEAERPHLRRTAELYDQLRQTDDPTARAEIFAAIDRETQATAPLVIPNELSRIYGSLGIQGVNAFTTEDTTVYHVDVPSNRLEAWAEVEVERFRDATFRLFQPELESVYEEKNRSLDEPWDRIDEALRLMLFPEHPYGTQPVLGLPEHLKTPAHRDMVEAMERWYVPNNMAILLVGDVDAATALPVLERTLGTLPPKPLPEPPKGELPPIRGRQVREVLAEGEESVTLAWRTVSTTDPDEPTMVVLDALMSNATRGLLQLQLELTQRVPSTVAWNTHMREAGYWVATATAREGQSLEEVEQLLLGVVAKLRAGEIEQATVDAVVLHEDIADAWRLESNEGRVERVLEAYVDRRPWPRVLERDARLRTVTKADVVAAANRYLGDDYAVVYRRRGTPKLPQIPKPQITPLEVDGTRQSAFSRRIAAMPARVLQPQWLVEGEHYERRTLPSGPLLAVANPRNQLYHVRLVIDRGHRKDRLLCHGLRLLELSGSGTKSAEALRDELYALGTTIRIDCDVDETLIDVSGIDRTMDASLRLLGEWLGNASFDAATLAGLDDDVLSERRDQLDDPDALADMVRSYAFYGEAGTYAAEPSNRELRAAKPATLARLVRGLLDFRHQAYYYGPRSADQAQAALGGLGRGTRDPGAYPIIEYRAVTEPTIYFLHKQVAKSTVSLLVPQGALPRERRPEARVLSEYMDGDMSSLLFMEIREARGLAYACGGFQATDDRPGEPWAFVGHIETQVDKTTEAIGTYLEVIRRPIDPARLADAKASLDQWYRTSRVDPRATFAWVRAWDLRGDKGDPRAWEQEVVAALDAAGLERLAATLRSQPVIIGLVGDRERIDLEALRTIGTVVEVEPSELTSYGAFPRAAAGPR